MSENLDWGADWRSDHNPIDTRLAQCLDGAGRDVDTAISCEAKAYKAWDDELNSVYKQLMSSLKPEQKAALKNEELDWLQKRDSEFLKIDKKYPAPDPRSIDNVLALDVKSSIVKDRTIELHDRLNFRQND